MPRSLLILLGIALAAFALPAHAATVFDPEAHWRSLETPHFRVNYEERDGAVAQRVGVFAEDAYREVTPFLKAAPTMKTEITLLDHEDTQNGFSVPYPNSMIYIYLTGPAEEALSGRYESYLKLLVTHEFTHAVHFEALDGTTALINQVFGRAIYPNLFQPFFLVEGLAVTAESLHSQGGRAREGDFDMILRCAALEGRLLDIDQASGWSSLATWPGGASTYIYGTYFYQYLMLTYGADAPEKIAHEYGSWPWFGINQAIGRALPGKTAYGLWDELKTYLRDRASAQLARIREHPLTDSLPVTTTGYLHFHPHWTPDGKLIYGEYGPNQSPILKLDAMDGTPGKRLVGKSPYGNYSLSGDRFVYLASGDEFRRYYTYNDLFRLDMQTKKVVKLTEGRRATDPAVSPDGRHVLATINHGGTTDLALFDSGGTLRQQLTHHDDGTQYSGTAWSPDGTMAVTSCWHAGSRDLYLLRPGVSDPEPLWRDSAVDVSPSWSSDGKLLYFASDRDGGVFNLFAYRLADRKLFQVTNVVGAAIDPAPSPDGKQLAFAGYSARGWDIRRMPLDPAAWREVPLREVTVYDPFTGRATPGAAVPDSEPLPGLDNPFPTHDYRPWHSLAPKTWSPVMYRDPNSYMVGVTTVGTDILNQHTVYANAGWSFGSARPYYVLSYQNDQLPPTLGLSLTDLPTLYGVSRTRSGARETYDIWQRQVGGALTATFPGVPSILLGSSWVQGQSLTLGYSWLSIGNLGMRPSDSGTSLTAVPSDLDRARNKPSAGQINMVSARYQFADNYRGQFAISPEYGNVLGVNAEHAGEWAGGTTAFDRLSIDARRYVSLPWKHHVIALRGATGANFGRSDGDYRLGGTFSSNYVTIMDQRYISGVESAALRGYSMASLSGNRMLETSAEYRFPLLSIQRGAGTLPFFLTNTSGAVFADAGWIGSDRLGDLHLGLGMEARLGLSLLFVPTELRLGVARGTHPMDGQTQVYAEAGISF